MGKFKKTKKTPLSATAPEPPKLALRRANRKSSFKMGRTISEKREKLETANERAAARRKDKKRKAARVFSTFLGFGILIIILVCIFFYFFGSGEPRPIEDPASSTTAASKPTIDIADENNGKDQLPARIENYIALAEQDFRDAGITPLRVVIPYGAIREVDFYVDGYPGYIKMTIDRDPAVSVEDAVRLYHYLDSIGVKNFSYIDVRIDGKAYWK